LGYADLVAGLSEDGGDFIRDFDGFLAGAAGKEVRGDEGEEFGKWDFEFGTVEVGFFAESAGGQGLAQLGEGDFHASFHELRDEEREGQVCLSFAGMGLANAGFEALGQVVEDFAEGDTDGWAFQRSCGGLGCDWCSWGGGLGWLWGLGDGSDLGGSRGFSEGLCGPCGWRGRFLFLPKQSF
jgi:hypothetical protein